MSQSPESAETSTNDTSSHVDINDSTGQANDSTGQTVDLMTPLLNYGIRLQDENAVLKYKNKELKDENDRLKKEIMVLKKRAMELSDEKEELKEAIKELKKQKEEFLGIQGKEKSLKNVTDESKTNTKKPHPVEKTSVEKISLVSRMNKLKNLNNEPHKQENLQNKPNSLNECLGAALHIFSKGAGGSADNIKQIISYTKQLNTRAESSEKPKTESKTENIK